MTNLWSLQALLGRNRVSVTFPIVVTSFIVQVYVATQLKGAIIPSGLIEVEWASPDITLSG